MIGRKPEQEELLRRYKRNKAEFVAIYGLKRNEYNGVITQVITLEDLLLE